MKRVLLYFLALLITLYLSIAFLEAFPTVLLSAELAFGLISAVYALVCFLCVRVSFKQRPKSIDAGKRLEMDICVNNVSFLPVLSGEIIAKMSYVQDGKDVKTAIPFGSLKRGRTVIKASFLPVYAGTVRIVPEKIRIYGFFGLLWFSGRIKHKGFEILVFPEYKTVAVNDHASRFMQVLPYESKLTDPEQINMVQFYRDRAGDDPSEVFQYRDFKEGDMVSRVDWKLSAKTGKMVVKDYSLPIIDRTLVLLDLNCAGQKEFHARAETCLSVCLSCIHHQCSVTLAWYDSASNGMTCRHVENDEDLSESFSMLLSARFCLHVSKELMLELIKTQYVYKQLICITGALEQGDREAYEQTRIAERIIFYIISGAQSGDADDFGRVKAVIIPEDSVKSALSNVFLDLY